MKDYYKILEVSPFDSQEEIKEQYRLLLHAWHPDKFPAPAQKAKAEEKTKEINEAYEILGDIEKRAQYDAMQRSQQMGKEESIRDRPPYSSPPPPATPNALTPVPNIGSCLFNLLVIVLCILGIRKIYLETRRLDINDMIAVQTIMPFIKTETNSISMTLQPTQATASPVQTTQTPQSKNFPQQNVRARLPTDQEFKNIPSIWDVNNISLLNLYSPGLRSYDVTVKTTDKLIWAYYWCASDASTLQANIEHLSLNFLIDNSDLPKSVILMSDREITGWSCRYWVTLLSDWKVGTVIQLDIKYMFSDTVFDGYENYPPGDYFFRLIVSVEQ